MLHKWLLLLALMLVFPVYGRALASNECQSSEEICVTEQICRVSDDTGITVIKPRTDQDSMCAGGRVCCDKAQLQRYYDRLPVQSSTIDMPNPTSESKIKPCGEQKICVPRILCNGTVNQDGRFLLQGRINSLNNFGCTPLEHCCPIADRLINTRADEDLDKFEYKSCGYSNPKGLIFDYKDFDDDETKFGQFPWMIALLDMQNKYFCGATLIHPRLVLTSAHNIINENESSLKARAGEWDLNSDKEPYPFQERMIRLIIRHENFDITNMVNDIALLQLAEPFKLAPHIQPICLPMKTPQVYEQFQSAKCFATGWGKQTATSEFQQTLLKLIELPVLEHQQCERLLHRTILGLTFILNSSFICAGGEAGKDTCKGDGGSPLFCTLPGEEDRYVLAGIVSWGLSCGEKDIPAGYTNIPHLREWIDGMVAIRGHTI